MYYNIGIYKETNDLDSTLNFFDKRLTTKIVRLTLANCFLALTNVG